MNPVLKAPFLPLSISFPQDPVTLSFILTKMYSDIVQNNNVREIAIYGKFQINTGQVWNLSSVTTNRSQALRQIYTIDSIASGTNIIPLGFTINSATKFVHIFGTGNSSTRSIPIPFINVAAPTDSIQLQVNRTTGNIEIITTTANYVGFSAIIVLEYLLNG